MCAYTDNAVLIANNEWTFARYRALTDVTSEPFGVSATAHGRLASCVR